MGVMGNIRQLGNWQDIYHGRMTWTEGHVWELDLYVPVKYASVFMYKYVVLDHN